MTKPFPTQDPPLGLGLARIFGAVSLLLFFLPVLSIPLGGAGLVFGFGGLALALFGGRASLRWSVVGIAVSVLALSVAVAIARCRRTICPCTLSRSTPIGSRTALHPAARSAGRVRNIVTVEDSPSPHRSSNSAAGSRCSPLLAGRPRPVPCLRDGEDFTLSCPNIRSSSSVLHTRRLFGIITCLLTVSLRSAEVYATEAG